MRIMLRGGPFDGRTVDSHDVVDGEWRKNVTFITPDADDTVEQVVYRLERRQGAKRLVYVEPEETP